MTKEHLTLTKKGLVEYIKKLPIEERLVKLYDALNYIENTKEKLILLCNAVGDAERAIQEDTAGDVEKKRVPPELYNLLKVYIKSTIDGLTPQNKSLIELVILSGSKEGEKFISNLRL